MQKGDRGNQGSGWYAGGLMGGQQVEPVAEGGMGQNESRAAKLVPAAGAGGKPALTRKTWVR